MNLNKLKEELPKFFKEREEIYKRLNLTDPATCAGLDVFRIGSLLDLSPKELADNLVSMGVSEEDLVKFGYNPDISGGSSLYPGFYSFKKEKTYRIGDILEDRSIVIGLNPEKTHGIAVADKDYVLGDKERFSWTEIKDIKLNGYRLPSSKEALGIFSARHLIPGLTRNGGSDWKVYWTNEEVKDGTTMFALYISIGNGAVLSLIKTYPDCFVRLVKEF